MIDASEIDDKLTPISDFDPSPGPPCDMESGLLDEVPASRFRAWTRVVDGHEETVAIGVWKATRDAADAQLDSFAEKRAACAEAGSEKGYSLDVASVDNQPSGGFRYWFTGKKPNVQIERTYTWTPTHEDGVSDNDQQDGYLVTVWMERADGSDLTGDTRKIMSAQLVSLTED
ncbi:hypothetical protein ACIO3S_27180 [Nocardioides sp. NPDC087217]|uniref:hypothetical protein n=1 Tax=Nocardioides sp. NPDC087217 TaxID=3364335 RepID=UPI0037FF05A1